MHLARLSLSGLSVLIAVGLGLWEIYFFFLSHTESPRLGMNLAWLVALYLVFQLISIPFAASSAQGRFVGVLDGLASVFPLGVIVVVLFGKSYLLASSERWEAAILLLIVNASDLFGGYAFNIALSRRTIDVSHATS